MPRRFAPRNDMQKLAACSHCKDALPGQIPTRLCVHPAAPLCTRRSAFVFCIPSRQAPLHPRTRPSFCMSLRASAHTGVAIRSPRMETWPVGTTLGKSVALPRIRLRCCSLLCAAAGDADCHVAPLLAMTCKNLPRVSIGNCVVPWQIRSSCVFAQSTAFCHAPPQGMRIATSLRSSQ